MTGKLFNFITSIICSIHRGGSVEWYALAISWLQIWLTAYEWMKKEREGERSKKLLISFNLIFSVSSHKQNIKKSQRLRCKSSPTATSEPSTPPLPPHIEKSGVYRPLIAPAPLTGAQKIHNQSALCQTDNPQHKPRSKCVCVHIYVYICARHCVLAHLCCVSGVVERIKGKEAAEGIWMEKR